MPRSFLLVLLAAIFLPAAAHAEPTEAWQAPTLSITRYDEDWSVLAASDVRDQNWTGQFKYIPISEDAWLSTGIELRVRHENLDNNLWGDAAAPGDSYVWFRALPYADLHVGKLRAFVQPIASTSASVAPTPGPIDQTGIDLLQGFVEAEFGPVILRGGRQMLSLGTERLIGTRYGPNVPLAFDGLRANIRLGAAATVSLLAVKPVQARKGDINDRTSHDKSLWGAYAVLPGLDLYYLGYRSDAARWGNREGTEARHSLGARFHGSRDDWHWNIEGVYQFGRFAGGPISAWTVGTEIGHAFPEAPLSPDLTLRVNAISGDGNRSDDRLGTFNAMFPKGKYFGELSPVGPYNIVNAYSALGLRLSSKVSASLAGVAYWRYSTADGIYDIPGNLVRAAGGTRARFIGTLIEGVVSWQANAELELSASISAFAPGAFIRATGSAKTIHMLGLESNLRF